MTGKIGKIKDLSFYCQIKCLLRHKRTTVLILLKLVDGHYLLQILSLNVLKAYKPNKNTSCAKKSGAK